MRFRMILFEQGPRTCYRRKLWTIQRALQEDLGSGDVTTESIVPPDAVMSGQIISKQSGVIAGLDVAQAAFRLLDDLMHW